MNYVLALSATLGFLSVSSPRGIFEDFIVGVYIFVGYALPEVRFLSNRKALVRSNQTLEFAGLLGTVVSLVLGLPKFGSSPEIVLSTFSMALLTTAIAQVLMIINLTIVRRVSP